jgi:AcrR family transcriptional regulator
MPRRTKEEAAQTRQAILDAARHEFASKGYTATSIADIAERTNVTHGALYHHFANKDALFRAVFDAVTDDLNHQVVLAAIEGVDALDQFTRGCRAVLERMTSDEYQQIALADGPSVIGMDEWRNVDSSLGLVTTVAGLELLQADGVLPPGPVQPLAVLIYGGLTEAGMQVARDGGMIDIDRAVDATVTVIRALGRLDRLP